MSNITFKLLPDKMGATTATQYIGKKGEIFYDIDGTTPLRLSDGVTPGGIPFAIISVSETYNPQFRDANGTFNIGTGSVTGSYVLQGLICHWRVNVEFAGTSNYGNSQYQITLPFPAVANTTTTTGTLHQVGSGGGSGANTRYHIAGRCETDINTTIMPLWYSGGVSDSIWKFNTPGGVPPANPTGPAYWVIANDAHFDIAGAYQIAS